MPKTREAMRQANERRNERRKERREEKRVAGLCVESKCTRKPVGRRLRCEVCSEKSRDRTRKQRAFRATKGLCIVCPEPPEPAVAGQKLCFECRKKYRKRNKDNWREIKLRVLNHYGMICAGCDEPEIDALDIDHINGGGNKHRKELGSTKFYRWLIDNNFPPGFRTLCPTCNRKAFRKIPLDNEKLKTAKVYTH